MDIESFFLSIKLGFWTLIFLMPISLFIAYKLSLQNKYKSFFESLLALPLVLPPTVLGYYLLVSFSGRHILGESLSFTFTGLVIASIIFNLPFAIQPIQRALEAIPTEIKEASACCGLSNWQSFRLIQLPLAWPGIISAAVMTFAHTLGEFGVVLMIGGSIPGQTKTVAIAIYDNVQTMNYSAAATMSLLLLISSLIAIIISYTLMNKRVISKC